MKAIEKINKWSVLTLPSLNELPFETKKTYSNIYFSTTKIIDLKEMKPEYRSISLEKAILLSVGFTYFEKSNIQSVGETQPLLDEWIVYSQHNKAKKKTTQLSDLFSQKITLYIQKTDHPYGFKVRLELEKVNEESNYFLLSAFVETPINMKYPAVNNLCQLDYSWICHHFDFMELRQKSVFMDIVNVSNQPISKIKADMLILTRTHLLKLREAQPSAEYVIYKNDRCYSVLADNTNNTPFKYVLMWHDDIDMTNLDVCYKMCITIALEMKCANIFIVPFKFEFWRLSSEV